ncbi:MAG: hypothetical protein M1814_004687 [Vezdaea aestivalis]|nr:MAG: hypothetical protein M1814_004687 [Vezdaea aestivalis]
MSVGVGVGDSSASPTAAILYTVLQETMGRIATILFAHRLGTSLEPECKMYRLAADVFNDTAMVLDYLSPVFPRPARVMILSLSSVLRALCGVAAGSAKATLSAHFARWHNLGDLNAKDSSQETVISLMGMLVCSPDIAETLRLTLSKVGSIMVSHVVSTGATWVCLLLLLSIHLYTNYLAVRAVQMTTLNRQRATIAFSHLIDLSEALSPAEVALKERIFETEIIRWRSAEVIGSCRFGAPLSVLLSLLPTPNSATKSSRTDALDLAILLDIFREQQYILWIDLKHCKTVIVIKQGCSVHSQLKAWLHALVLHHAVATQSPSGSKVSDVVKLVADSLKIVEANSEGFLDRLRAKGWDTSTPALETMSSYRISVEGAKNAFKPEVSVPKMPYIRPSGGE